MFESLTLGFEIRDYMGLMGESSRKKLTIYEHLKEEYFTQSWHLEDEF